MWYTNASVGGQLSPTIGSNQWGERGDRGVRVFSCCWYHIPKWLPNATVFAVFAKETWCYHDTRSRNTKSCTVSGIQMQVKDHRLRRNPNWNKRVILQQLTARNIPVTRTSNAMATLHHSLRTNTMSLIFAMSQKTLLHRLRWAVIGIKHRLQLQQVFLVYFMRWSGGAPLRFTRQVYGHFDTKSLRYRSSRYKWKSNWYKLKSFRTKSKLEDISQWNSFHLCIAYV